MLIKMNEVGFMALEAPLDPKVGCKSDARSARNFPSGALYAPPKHRIAMAMAVYVIPAMPTIENGAKEERFLSRQRGRMIPAVTPNSVLVRDTVIPTVRNKSLKVSAKIMLYAKFAARQLKALEAAGNQEVSVPTVLSHASRYDTAPV